MKVYQSKMPSFTTTLHLDDGSRFVVMFINGEFSTAGIPDHVVEADVIKHIEALDMFGRSILIKSQEAIDADNAVKAKAIADGAEQKKKYEAEAQKKIDDAKAAEAQKEATQKALAKQQEEKQAEHDKMVSDIYAQEAAKKKSAEADAKAKLESGSEVVH